jgi:hypothetical protein
MSSEVRFVVLMVVTMKCTICCSVTLCSVADVFWCWMNILSLIEAVLSSKMLICSCHFTAWCHNPKDMLGIHMSKVYFGLTMHHTGLKSWEGACCWVADRLQDLWRDRVSLMNGSTGCVKVHLCMVCLGLELKIENVFMKIPCYYGNAYFAHVGLNLTLWGRVFFSSIFITDH